MNMLYLVNYINIVSDDIVLTPSLMGISRPLAECAVLIREDNAF